MDRYAHLMISGEQFEMAPLNEFTVTEKKYPVKGAPLPKVNWADWLRENQARDYGLPYKRLASGKSPIKMNMNRPTDVDPVLDEATARDYELVWADDPEPA